jgi:hypothetical protein
MGRVASRQGQKMPVEDLKVGSIVVDVGVGDPSSELTKHASDCRVLSARILLSTLSASLSLSLFATHPPQ